MVTQENKRDRAAKKSASFSAGAAGAKEVQADGFPDLGRKAKRLVIGPPRDLNDRSLFHRLALIPFLAWIGLGSDGLSSSCYGPEEAFRMLGSHFSLAIGLALAICLTVGVISIAYSRVIEHFPTGGGGYVVAHKLLGENAGVVSGCALIVDYVLTIAMSISAAGDALMSMAPLDWWTWKPTLLIAIIGVLFLLNLRGVKESVLSLAPIFLVFVATHVILIGAGVGFQGPHLASTFSAARADFSDGLATLGAGGLFLLFIHAYSMGGGTYTGIEAVSNGLMIMREPRVESGKRTMLYMAISLSFTASGLLLCYMLWRLNPMEGKTMNALLVERVAAGFPYGRLFVWLTLISEGALLIVAAQTGYVDGPRVLANMALDSWAPRRFAALSDRLVMQNGVMIMGGAALAVVLYTHGDVRKIVVMYSINVFLTFSLTELSMCRFWIRERVRRPDWAKKIIIHLIGLSMCLTILTMTVIEKFFIGGWLTLAITCLLVLISFLVHRHYRRVGIKLGTLFQELENEVGSDEPRPPVGPIDPGQPTAVVLVAGYSGLGVHTILNLLRMIPNHFRNLVFVSVGVIDSGSFKGEDTIAALKRETEANLKKYLKLAERLGLAATYRFSIGTDTLDEAEKLCREIGAEFPRSTFFAGKIILSRPKWHERFLHNETAFAIQKRLQLQGKAMVIIPAVA